MANRKNNTKETILKEALRLFYENGYEATTYQAIADATGKQRTLVQHHFPEKSAFAGAFLDQMNLEIEKSLEELGCSGSRGISSLYRFGQLNLSFLLMDENMRRFTKELVGNREHTIALYRHNETWVTDYYAGTPVVSGLSAEAISESYTLAMGGTYEVLYSNLVSEKKTDVAHLLKKTMEMFFGTLGYGYEEIDRAIENDTFSPEELETATEGIKKALFPDS